EALGFDFREVFPEDGCRSRTVTVTIKEDGVLDAVMMTWDLALGHGQTYSTRPGAENWQDHWVPSFYPLVGGTRVNQGDRVHLKACHSELNMSFEI
ncbi:unnamed protein product, partial [Discosporangium mesarthrocarpum]